jgi:peptide/nickel transport system substrate-binding protein
MKRRAIIHAAAAVTAGLVSRPFAIAAPEPSRVLRIVPQAGLTSLDPIWTTALVTANHGYNVYDTLFATDSKLRSQPQMAEGYTVSDDARTWLIRLRDGLKFHDGEPVRAQDCAASLARWAKRDTYGLTLDKYVDSYGAADDRTIRISLKSPFPLLIDAIGKSFTSVPFMMPERFAKTDPFKQVTEAIGSGPYRFIKDEYVPGSLISYAKFAGYQPRQEPPDWSSGGKVPYMDRVEWRFIPDAATAAAALQNGEVDWWEQVQADLVPLLAKSRDIKLGISDPTGNIGYMRFNHLQPPFDNLKLRKAVLKAVNQDDYLTAVTGGDRKFFQQCRSLFPCGTPYAREIGASLYKADIEASKADVAASGYAGEKIVIINPTDFASIAPFGDVTYDLFRKLGLNVDIAETDWGTVVQRRASREPVEKGGWSVFHTWWTGASTANPVVSAPLRGQGGAGWFGWYENAQVEALTTKWLQSTVDTDRQQLADAIQREAFETVPSIPLGQFFIRSAYRADLAGLLEGTATYSWNVRRD